MINPSPMKKINYEGVREGWLKHGGAEAELWLHHIDAKKDAVLDLQKKSRAPIFEQAELLFNIFSFTNWLAHIDLRNAKHIKEQDMVDWLQKVTTWPLEVVEAFWYCLRNPLMHTGRTFFFSDYDRKSASRLKLYADMHPNLDFDPKRFQPEAFKPGEAEDGWFAVRNPDDESKLEVTFYLPGVRRKLGVILKAAMEGIRVANNDSLAALSKVNRKLLAFRVVGAN
jgi:hypothetical protein